MMTQLLGLLFMTLASLACLANAGDDTTILFQCNFDNRTACGGKLINWEIVSKSRAVGNGMEGPKSDTSGAGLFLNSQTNATAGVDDYNVNAFFIPTQFHGEVCLTFSYFKYGGESSTMYIKTKYKYGYTSCPFHGGGVTDKWVTRQKPILFNYTFYLALVTEFRNGSIAGIALDDIKVTKGRCQRPRA